MGRIFWEEGTGEGWILRVVLSFAQRLHVTAGRDGVREVVSCNTQEIVLICESPYTHFRVQKMHMFFQKRHIKKS